MEKALPIDKKRYKKPLWQRIWAAKASYIMIGPFMILFILFSVIPVGAAIVLSFTDFNMLQTPNFVGLNNYRSLFMNDDVFMTVVKNTLVLAFITGPLSYMLCFGFAWLINELPGKLRAFMTMVFYVPSISGGLMFIWTYIFSGDRYGVLNGLLMELGILDEAIQWTTDTDYMLIICIIVEIWGSLGTSFLAFMAGFKTVDEDLYEAAAIDGVRNRFQEVWHVTLPQMKPQLMFGAVMQIATAFAVGSVEQALTGFPSTDYATHTVMLHINDYGNIRYELGYACAISTVLLVFMQITNKVITRVLKED
ncbi:MAG: sugar ABC transporter permease [Lachnospiraceae bacterium]|nr:sugar ABC transporter permease [Lachnospiraceae bacterium]